MKRVVTAVGESGRSYIQVNEEIEPDDSQFTLWSYNVNDDAIRDWIGRVELEPWFPILPGEVRWVYGTVQPTTREELHWHATPTVDFAMLPDGELTLLVDDGEVELQPGDVVVQQATRHAWWNRGSEPVVLLGVMNMPTYVEKA
jgi:quercetin dioxygenase-like cupin family protein